MSASLRGQLEETAMGVQELGDIDRAITSGVRHRTLTSAAVTVIVLLCVGVLAAAFMTTRPGVSRPEPLQPPTPAPEADVKGWPGGGRNAPGDYSLSGITCGWNGPGRACNDAWMHNGYGSGDVEISIDPKVSSVSDEVEPNAGSIGTGVPVVVAGYDGIYRRVDVRHERWILDVEGTSVVIEMKARPRTSRADLTEAHAIIDSMRTDSPDNGVRLIFTLTSNDWDSG